MKVLVVLLIPCVFAHSAQDREAVGFNVTNSYSGKIQFASRLGVAGGQEILAHTAPYQAAVYNTNSDLCGGVVISRIAVLTSATCLGEVYQVRIVLGAHNISEFEEHQETYYSYNIEKYDDGYNDELNDIAILILSEPLTYNRYIREIALAPAFAGNFVGATAVFTGWGATFNTNFTISSVLKGVELEIITEKRCRRIFNDVYFGELCTSGEGNNGACIGDFGGPLVINDILVGIASGRKKECQNGKPSIFSRISYYKRWIDDVLGDYEDRVMRIDNN